MSSSSTRRDQDLMKLMMKGYNVETIDDRLNECHVELHGPKDSPYEGGVWKVYVGLPDDYPFNSGSVCLNVLNEAWNPTFDLSNIFEVFLPQLLLEPNPFDPLNDSAASLMIHDKNQYDQKVKEYCERYAKKEDITDSKAEKESDEDVSDGRSASSDDFAGHVDLSQGEE